MKISEKSSHQEATIGRLFNKFIDDITESSIKNRCNSYIFNNTNVERRILQKFTDLEMYSFKSQSTKYDPNDLNSFINQKEINFDRFKYTSYDKKLSIKRTYFIKCLIKFFLDWLKVMLLVIKSTFFLSYAFKKATLVYGIHKKSFDSKNKRNEFLNFCKYGPITPLNKAEYIIVDCDDRKINPYYSNIINFCKNPLLCLMSFNSTTLLVFLIFIRSHFATLFYYLKSSYNNPLLILLHEDFAYYSLVDVILKEKIENIIITPSNTLSQQLWMNDIAHRKYLLHMAWYSQNGEIELIYNWNPVVQFTIGFMFIKVDEHWVWTKRFGDSLNNNSIDGKFNYVGPILWYMPKYGRIFNKKKNEIFISVFDVTPFNKEQLIKTGREEIYYYYSAENMCKFIGDIINVAKKLEFEGITKKCNILLKHKKEHLSTHSKKYIDFIEYSSKNGSLIVLSSDTNLFSLVESTDFSIVIPYSTPAYVSAYMNKHAIYYDPTKTIVPRYEKLPELIFASGSLDLEEKIYELIK